MSFIVLDPFNVQSLPFMCNSGRKQNLYANEKKYNMAVSGFSLSNQLKKWLC